MKMLKSLGLMAAAGALMVTAQSSQATITFKSSVSVKLKATVQDLVEDETNDGYVNTTMNLSIVNKDILAVFEDWWDTTLPAGADLAYDVNYNVVIVDKDGNILFDGEDLSDFFVVDYGPVITSDGRYKEKDNGDSTSKFTETYAGEVLLLPGNVLRNAELQQNHDGFILNGLDTYSYSSSFDASKSDYKSSETDKYEISGTGIVEDSSASISGTVSAKYNYKDDNYTP